MASDSVKHQILTAAGSVFADHGFKSATVREICKSASVNVAAVNYYFGDKQQLYLETVRLARRLKTERLPMPEWPDSVSPKEQLHQYVHVMLQRMLGEQDLWQTRLMMREVMRPTDACRSLVEDYFRPQFERLLKIVDQLVPNPVSTEKSHQLAFSVIGQCFFYLAARDTVPMMITEEEMKTHFAIDELANHIANFAFAAISSPNIGRDESGSSSQNNRQQSNTAKAKNVP